MDENKQDLEVENPPENNEPEQVAPPDEPSPEQTDNEPAEAPAENDEAAEEAAPVPEEVTPESTPATPPVEEVAPNHSEQKPKRFNKKMIIIIVAALVILSGGAFAAISLTGNEETPVTETTEEIETPVANIDDEEVEPEEEIPEKLAAGELPKKFDSATEIEVASWLGTPAEIAFDDTVFDRVGEAYLDNRCCADSADNKIPKKSTKFYKVGELNDGRDIVLIEYTSEGLGTNYYPGVFLHDGTNWEFLKLNSPGYYSSDVYVGYEFSSAVTVVDDKYIRDFAVIDTINIQGADITSSSWSSWGVPAGADECCKRSLDDYMVLEETEFGTMYVKFMVLEDLPGVSNYNFMLEQSAGTLVAYNFALTNINDDYSLAIDWNDNTTTTDQYAWTSIRFGCGSGGVNSLNEDQRDSLVASGVDSNGNTVYELNSVDHPVFTGYNKYYNSTVTNKNKKISANTMYNNHGMIFVENELGYLVALVNNKYAPLVECAKPVIYLYPEVETTLDVKVGANVTKSDPVYGNGWTVTASPNGQLTVDGQQYDSLFWDGIGHGPYPNVSQGFIVERSKVASTLRSHLSGFGLNQKESNDFMEFWMPLMPNDPYVRITWFDTPMMDVLAPLTLSVQPDTSIRIFLDFEGLNSPYPIEPQSIYAKERKGFTLVEWGGLKIGN